MYYFGKAFWAIFFLSDFFPKILKIDRECGRKVFGGLGEHGPYKGATLAKPPRPPKFAPHYGLRFTVYGLRFPLIQDLVYIGPGPRGPIGVRGIN